jgi:hypothetical protein
MREIEENQGLSLESNRGRIRIEKETRNTSLEADSSSRGQSQPDKVKGTDHKTLLFHL